jgi:endonuclease/exonuclease/phosphatase (EEP) superfamily protein YafD
VIVGGDVNTNPYLWEEGEVPLVPTAQIVETDQAPILDDYMRALGFETPAADVGPTHRALGIESRLDAIYARGFTVSDAHVEHSMTSSDHWPVWVDVTLP